MIFKQVKIHNFLAVGEAKVELNNLGFVKVVGINNTDNSKSNGAGKSTILNAIHWCLCGETAEGETDVKNKFIDAGECSVETEFIADNGKEYSIERTKGKSIRLIENGTDISGKGIRDTDQLIKEMFPQFEPTMIASTMLFGQGMPNCFTYNTGAKRKEILEALTRSDFMIDDIKTRLTKIKERTTIQLREMEDSLLSVVTLMNQVNSKLARLYRERETFPSASEILKRINTTKEELVKMEGQRKDIDQIVGQGQTLSDDILYLEKKDSESRAKELQCANMELSEAVGNVRTVSNEIDRLSREIKRLEAVIEFCPTCKQKLPDVHKIDTTAQKQNLNEAQQNMIAFREVERKVRLQIEMINKKQGESSNLIEEKRNTQQKLRAEYQEQKQLLNKMEQMAKELNSMMQEQQKHQDKYDAMIKQIADDEIAISEHRAVEEAIKVKIGDIKAKAEMINKIYSYATKEFRTILLEDTILQLEKRAKELCLKVLETDQIEFKQEGSGIYIGYNGKPLGTLSGGEKQVVKLCIQLALRDVIERQSGNTYSMLWIDEVFDSLDEQRAGKVIDLISTLNTESIFIISHHSDLQLPSDIALVVEKNNNIAEIRWE